MLQSLTWLFHHYFLPTLSPSTDRPHSARLHLRSLDPTLKQYKHLLKVTTRDASLRSQYQMEIAKLLRAVERWIAGARVSANVAAGELSWDIGGAQDDAGDDTYGKERWALEQFCDALLQKGVLVPLSRK